MGQNPPSRGGSKGDDVTHFTDGETESQRGWERLAQVPSCLAKLKDMSRPQNQWKSSLTTDLSSSLRLCKGLDSVNICKLDVWAYGSRGCP